MSGSVADVRSGLPAEVADLLAPPARPWWRWLVSDRAARYTARIAFLLIWQWAGTVFDDIPTPISTVEFLIEEFRAGEVWPNVAISPLSGSMMLVPSHAVRLLATTRLAGCAREARQEIDGIGQGLRRDVLGRSP